MEGCLQNEAKDPNVEVFAFLANLGTMEKRLDLVPKENEVLKLKVATEASTYPSACLRFYPFYLKQIHIIEKYSVKYILVIKYFFPIMQKFKLKQAASCQDLILSNSGKEN